MPSARPYRCRTRIRGLHNYAIEAIEEEGASGTWVRVAEFDGSAFPPWESLPASSRRSREATSGSSARRTAGRAPGAAERQRAE